MQRQNDAVRESTAMDDEEKKLNPVIYAGIATFVVLNVGMLLSLPPVLIGKGAPYLPTFKKSMDAMFHQLKKEPEIRKRISSRIYQQQIDGVVIYNQSTLVNSTNAERNTSYRRNEITNNDKSNNDRDEQQQQHNKHLIFVDLGSGDGRLVFRAARENIFDQCIGYEINPVLHSIALIQRLLGGPKYWNTRTNFYMRNLWDVNLHDADVVAVYGLGPIMKELGKKLENELKPGSYVLSNVFTIPGWKATSSVDGTYIYRIKDRE